MNDISFKEGKIGDLAILNEISVRSKKHWRYPDEWVERWLDDLHLKEYDFKNQYILIIEIDRQIVGFCSISKEDNYFEILHLWLLPDYIGKGYGRQLLNNAIEMFVPENSLIKVEAEPNAEDFYQKNGFATVGKRESYPPGRFLPLMEKRV